MPFDINDPQIREILGEEKVNLQKVSELERNQKNYLKIQEDQSLSYLELELRRDRFDKVEFERLIDNQISELE